MQMLKKESWSPSSVRFSYKLGYKPRDLFFDSSHWLKSQHSGWRALKSITGHVIYNPAYD